MTQALEAIRVLDLTSGPAGGIATMILADFGAEVILIERPQDPFNDLPAARMWRRGKARLPLDLNLDGDRLVFDELCAGADVLICNWRTSALERKRLDYPNLHERFPQLVFCHVSGFGSRGPRADYPGYEHLVAACIGRMQLFAGLCDREGPGFSALQVGVHATAQSAVSGILAALYQRGPDGPGRLVETSLLQGLLPYEQGAMLGQQFAKTRPDVIPVLQSASPEPPLPSLYYHPAQAGDGRWMQFGNLLAHLFDNFLIATGLIDVIADPDWNAMQMLLPPEKQEAFRERMLRRIQDRPADEWMADFIADGNIVAAAYQTTQQAIHDPDIVANGHVIELDGCLQIGPVARLLDTPAAPGREVVDGDVLARTWRRSPKTITAPPVNDAPLEGVRVVEIATIIAAPLGASFLADMGADVVKVEPIGGDPYRGLGAGVGSARVNAGKRSISVDLKSERGRKIVQKLVKEADVLIHNFRPGVPERLGIGYDELSRANPGLVYLQSNGYGPDGPSAMRPSTHPVPGAAMGGVMFQMRESLPDELQDIEGLRLWTRRLMRANEVNPDPNTAMVICTSVLLGLLARQQTGKGQRILVDMFGANAYANHDDFLSFPDKPPRLVADELMHGLAPGYRLYPAADGEWIFLAAVTGRERAALEATLLDEGYDAPTAADFDGQADALTKRLATIFASRSASDWESLLAPAGVGCVQADAWLPSEFWLHDEQATALGTAQPVAHPFWGDYLRHGANVTFDAEQPHLKPPPMGGQHNRELLAELGFNDEEIEELARAGVVWQEGV